MFFTFRQSRLQLMVFFTSSVYCDPFSFLVLFLFYPCHKCFTMITLHSHRCFYKKFSDMSLFKFLDDWDYEVSCCRDVIIAIRFVGLANILITTAVSMILFKVLSKAKVINGLHYIIINFVFFRLYMQTCDCFSLL